MLEDMFDAAWSSESLLISESLCCHQCESSLLRVVVVVVHVTWIYMYMYVLCMYLQTKAGACVSINTTAGLGSL
jgi:hypothetical protein